MKNNLDFVQYIGFGRHFGEIYSEEEAMDLAQKKIHEMPETEFLQNATEQEQVQWYFSGGFFRKWGKAEEAACGN